MSAHELAQALLAGPNFIVVCEDGGDPSDTVEVTRLTNDKRTFFDRDGDQLTGNVISLR